MMSGYEMGFGMGGFGMWIGLIIALLIIAALIKYLMS